MNLSRRDLLRLGAAGAGALAAAGVLEAASRLGAGQRPGGAGRFPAGGPATDPDGPAILLSAPGVAIVPRSGWGADESLRTQAPIFAPVRQLFVHHTVTGNGAPPAEAIQSIYQSHLAEGFIDIGYNFLIDAAGTVYEGRWSRDYGPGETPMGQDAAGMGVVGAHVAQHDYGSVGIAMLGTFSSALPTGAALNSLMVLLAWLCDIYGLDPRATTGGEPVIAGHRDANQTACPGDDLYRQLPGLRDAVTARIAANAANGKVPAPTCTLLVPGNVSATATPSVSGQVSRSVTRVDVTFAGAAGARTVSAPASTGTFSVAPGSYVLGLAALPADTYTVQAVAVDGAGNTSPPTTVATGFRVAPGAALPSGYWVLGADGGVFAYGQAAFLGSTGGQQLNAPVVAMEATPAGDGYWLVASDGGIFAYGAAAFFGSTGSLRLNKPIVGITASSTGNGYRLVASDGGIFSFGDAPFFGSTGSLRLNKPIVGMAATPSGNGYWLVASDGGIFSFGDAGFFGSAGAGGGSKQAIVGIEPTPSGQGYWLVSVNGEVLAYGDAPDHGSVVRNGINDPNCVALVATRTGAGYYIVDALGQVFAFGDAPTYGSPLTSALDVNAIGIVLRA